MDKGQADNHAMWMEYRATVRASFKERFGIDLSDSEVRFNATIGKGFVDTVRGEFKSMYYVTVGDVIREEGKATCFDVRSSAFEDRENAFDCYVAGIELMRRAIQFAKAGDYPPGYEEETAAMIKKMEEAHEMAFKAIGGDHIDYISGRHKNESN